MIARTTRRVTALPERRGPAASFSVRDLARWIARYGELIAHDVDVLTELDAAIGDADHGVNMNRGMVVVTESLAEMSREGATLNSLCQGMGKNLISAAGGAAGMLYGTFFLMFGAAAGDVQKLPPEQFSTALQAGLQGVTARGGAQADDKTMVDAMAPAVGAFAERVAAGAWDGAPAAAVLAAHDGCERITPLVARKGRASYLGPRSAGHADPGAASTLLLFTALRDVLSPVSQP